MRLSEHGRKHARGDGPPAGTGCSDFAEIKDACAPLRSQLDYHYLNEVEGLENPTSEILARWIWDRLAGTPPLSQVVARENWASGCIDRGEVA